MLLHPVFLHELKSRFTGDLRFDAASKYLYSTDASLYQIEPLGVAVPKSQDDLHAAVELASKYKIPILPRGSGTSLAGQAIGEALVLDCSRYLDSIIEIDPESQTAWVEPGVILSKLNRAVSKYNLMFGPDPASAERATMGGVIGNNATGAHSIVYGMSADHLLEADAILSDGSLSKWGIVNDGVGDKKRNEGVMQEVFEIASIIREKYSDSIKRNYPRAWRNSAGYRLNYLVDWSPSKPPQWVGEYPNLIPDTWNLAPLLAGSEGTLAVIRRMKVNLVSKPKYTILGVLAYDSIVSACDDVPRLLELNPSAIELIPQLILKLARGVPAFSREMNWIQGDPAAILAVEFSGDNQSELRERVLKVGQLIALAETKEEQARVWNVRKMGLGILDSRPNTARPAAFIEDCAVPVERLGEFVREVERILAEHNTDAGIYAHASGGCLHIRPILNLQSGDGVRKLRSISAQVFELVMSLGGSMSSEHGDGIARGEWIGKTYGVEISNAMRMLKQAADPYNLLNPRKMLDAPPMDTQLRYGENYSAKPWGSSLTFSQEHGLAGAIEQCNGQGVCRKDTGVMCPSFQATRDEANSTRGRANLLRGLISNNGLSYSNDRDNSLTDAAFQALDLCLACKGCTSECPSGVDMPRLKYEFMNEYYKSHRRPLHDYLFGYFHVAAKWLSPFAPVVNPFMKMNWSRMLIASVAGISLNRELPQFAKRKNPNENKAKSGEKGVVVLLSDVFSRYLEPEVEDAAVEILTRLGYEVKILNMIGSGASLLSKGFIKPAKQHAEKVIAEIEALGIESIVGLVGVEPPEIYCVKHEYDALLPDRDAELEIIKKKTWLMDEFIMRVANKGKLGDFLPSDINPVHLTFQPHCHQRAEAMAEDGLPSGTSATVEMLKMFGYDVELIDAGCCGMAGTFGFDAEHYELSMQVGELGVLPKIRNSELGIMNVVSTGAACRMQIRHGTGVDAVHPLVLVKERLISNK